LINNAAILDWTPLAELGEARLAEVLRVNFGGAVNCSQHLRPKWPMARPQELSMCPRFNGLRGTANSVAYNASKAALLSLTQSLAVELAPRGIAATQSPGFHRYSDV